MTAPNFDMSGKVAIITGGSRGIGFAMAEALAGAGAQVVLSARKQDALDEAARKISENGGEAVGIAAHTGDQAAIDTLIEDVIARYGRIDVLINNAATNPHFGPILTAEESQWDKILDVNVKGYFRMVKACVPHMEAVGGGSVINVASVAGLQPQPMMGVYSVSKAAVIMLTQTLAAELAGIGVRVNCIAPGFVKTKFSSALWSNPSVEKALTKAIPQGRVAEPGEIAGMALYLASEASSFTTGGVFVVDGGQLASNPFSMG